MQEDLNVLPELHIKHCHEIYKSGYLDMFNFLQWIVKCFHSKVLSHVR